MSINPSKTPSPTPVLLRLLATKMRACKTLIHASFSKQPEYFIPKLAFTRSILSLRPLSLPAEVGPFRVHAKPYNSIHGAVSVELVDEISEKSDKVEQLLKDQDEVLSLMKMERKGKALVGEEGRWFPYFDAFKCPNGLYLTSDEVVEAVSPYVMEERKERFRRTVKGRSYSVCLVVEGLSDFGNVSATFRSADALGFQSVHVVSCDSSKRYRENRHVSMGAEKWLDIELWDSTRDCFKALKSRGYRIATTHLGRDTVSIYDMDWSRPTAIVVGNEHRGISDEALEFSDLHCSIPMNGMVDSFNVSVAAGLLMHHAVCDRVSRLGYHGDLTSEESQILFSEFLLRHSKSMISIAHEHGKRKAAIPISNL